MTRRFQTAARRALLFATLFALAATLAPSRRARGAGARTTDAAQAGFVSVELPATNEVRIENRRGGVLLEVWGENYLAVATADADGAPLPADAGSPVRLDRGDRLLNITVPPAPATRARTPAPAAPRARAKTPRRPRRRAHAARASQPAASIKASDSPRPLSSGDPTDTINLAVRVPARARVSVVTSGGRVSARGVPASLDVQSVAGDVRVELPTVGADADIMARTLDGTITVGAGVAAPSARTLRERFAARLGAGARLVRLSSVRGSISLETSAEIAEARDAAPDTRGSEARARTTNTAPAPDARPTLAGDSQPDRAKRPPVLVGAGGSPPQRPAAAPTPNAPEEVGEGDVMTVDTSVVTLNFSVVDRQSGRGLTNLIGADFRVTEDGAEQRITHFEQTSAPFDLLLLLDLSGSTAHVTDLIRASALRFVNSVRPDDRVAVVAFAAQPSVVSPLAADKSLLRTRLAQLAPPVGDTKLYDAINYSLDYLEANSPKARRRAVVLLTDGMDSSLPNVTGEGSKTDFKELRRRVEEFDGLFYAIMTDNYEEPQSPLDVQPETYDMAWDRMEELTKVAGGLYYEAEELEDVADIYGRVVEDLGTVYSISYIPINKARDGRWRAVKVRLPRRPEAVARGKSGYYAK
ncbi:MAG: VWA domain-containing protein [Pyrinomonadaceae bacterium]